MVNQNHAQDTQADDSQETRGGSRDNAGQQKAGSASEGSSEAQSELVDTHAGGSEEQSDAGSQRDGDSQGSQQQESSRPRQPTYIETLERKLLEHQEQLREYIAAYKQVKEDQEAFKKRLEREAARDQEMTRGRLVNDLLEVLDNLDRSVLGGEAGWNAESLLMGIKMVHGQFLEKLQGLGLKVVDPQGKPFNPNEAEALDMSVTTDPSLDDTVSRVYVRGYRMGDRVIRPAKVQVARFQKSDGDA